MKISAKSQLGEQQIVDFLLENPIPMRIAANDGEFPLICSLWFIFDAESQRLLAASHETSRIIKVLQQNSKCGFEIATNDTPYKGVRGQGNVELHQRGVADTLRTLIGRYLESDESSLAQWLLSRTDDEYVVAIKPEWITGWDYSNRM